MQTVNIHEAKTHLSRLIEAAVRGESFIIAKAGKPLVKVTAIEPEPIDTSKRIGFMRGEMEIPDDIKEPFKDEIEEMFYGKP